jgi:hypothetical protein
LLLAGISIRSGFAFSLTAASAREPFLNRELVAIPPGSHCLDNLQDWRR